MSKTNKLVLSLALLAVVLGTGISIASAYPGNSGEKSGFQDRQQISEAIENDDYQTWQSLMNEKADLMAERLQEMRENINQERFEQIKEVRALVQEGKYEEARELREEMGIGGFMGRGFGPMRHFEKEE